MLGTEGRFGFLDSCLLAEGGPSIGKPSYLKISGNAPGTREQRAGAVETKNLKPYSRPSSEER